MNKNPLLLLMALTLALLMASCSSSDFKIDGQLTGLNGTMVRMTFCGDSGVIDDKIPVDKKGHFSFKGQAAQPVLVLLSDITGKPLVSLVAANGDHLKVQGDASKPMGVKVKGNRLNEDWQLFRDEHAGFYTDPNPSRLDAAIEKYIAGHPADLLSTVLLVADYGDFTDRAKMDKLLESIDAKVRPESLTDALKAVFAAHSNGSLPRMMTLTLLRHGADFESITLTGRVTLLRFWANPKADRDAVNRKIETAVEGTDVRVVDILAESDTLRWHQTIATDPAAWQHYWAPGGPLEQGIQLLGLSSMPWYAVTDTTGLVTYNGPDLTQALRVAHAPE